MGRPLIVIGDVTDHGGTVVGASAVSDTHGKRIARVGDLVTCPKKGHGGTTTIVSGDPTFIIDGAAAARHGDKCACGATLVASQAVTTAQGGGVQGACGPASNAAHLRDASAEAVHGFDEQVELVFSSIFAAGVPYFIRTSDGRTRAGRVGPDGRLPRIETPSKETYTVWVGDEALALMNGGTA